MVFFFNFFKLKKTLNSVFSKTLPNQKNIRFQFFTKKNSIKRPPVSSRFSKKELKEPVGILKEPTKNQQFGGRFFDPVLWIFLEPWLIGQTQFYEFLETMVKGRSLDF